MNTSPDINLGADADVRGSVASVVNALSGEPLTGVALAQPRDRSLPIDARVTAKLKAKKWANEFISIGHLITVTSIGDKFNLSINTSKHSWGQHTFCQKPLQKAKPLVPLKPGLLLSKYFLAYIHLDILQKLQL